MASEPAVETAEFTFVATMPEVDAMDAMMQAGGHSTIHALFRTALAKYGLHLGVDIQGLFELQSRRKR